MLQLADLFCAAVVKRQPKRAGSLWNGFAIRSDWICLRFASVGATLVPARTGSPPQKVSKLVTSPVLGNYVCIPEDGTTVKVVSEQFLSESIQVFSA